MPSEAEVVADFHRLYFERSEKTWQNTHYMGVPVAKCPLDLWIYQEIIWETKPELIIETGTYYGGSALYLCDTMLSAGLEGNVVSIDIQHPEFDHPQIAFITGDSADPEIAAKARLIAEANLDDALKEIALELGIDGITTCRTMVILDSNHSQEHVASELALYAPLVTRGCYLIVEDTNVNGHPVLAEHGPGPMEAVADFITSPAGEDFRVDRMREKFFLTFNKNGYLWKVG